MQSDIFICKSSKVIVFQFDLLKLYETILNSDLHKSVFTFYRMHEKWLENVSQRICVAIWDYMITLFVKLERHIILDYECTCRFNLKNIK